MNRRPVQIAAGVSALVLLGAVSLVVAQEAAPPAPANRLRHLRGRALAGTIPSARSGRRIRQR